MTLGPVAAAPLVASGTSDHVSNPLDHVSGDALDAQLQVDEGDATGIAGDVQLSDARTTFHGEAMNDSLGETVAGIGDVTGDGTDDVALGAPEAADGAGAVYHFFGPVAQGDLDASESDLTVTGAESGDWAGADVAAADLTGDGMRDLVIGAPQANAGTGAVYVFYGADLRAAVDDGASEVSVADASVTMTGDSDGGLFGTAVAAHGHEHAGDDAPMLAVGAPGTDGDAGAVYTFSDVTSDATAADANAVVTGPAQGDQAGWSLAMADNYTDAGDAALIVGAPQHDGTGAVGILTDVSGDASLADADRLLLGEGDGDRAGWAVDEAGDVDNDGLTDVVIGSPLNDALGEDAGAAYVVHAGSQAGSTNLANADAVVRGEQAGDTAGYDVSAAGSGDVTCDEYDDVLVGAPGHDANGQQDAGAAYIVAGGDTLQGDYSLATAQAKLHGENAGDLAGFSVTDAMDVTDNGDKDVLVGAPGADKNAGAAYLVEGECPADGVAEEPRTDEPVVEEPDKEEPKEEEPAKEEPTDKEDRDEDVDKDVEDDRDEDVDQDVKEDRDDDADKDREDGDDAAVDDGVDKDGEDGDDGDVGDGDKGDVGDGDDGDVDDGDDGTDDGKDDGQDGDEGDDGGDKDGDDGTDDGKDDGQDGDDGDDGTDDDDGDDGTDDGDDGDDGQDGDDKDGDWTIDAFGPSDVPADGQTEAEFTVTLEDENGDRVAGELIELVDADDALDDLPSGVNTNDNGVATFTATSEEVGTHAATFTHAETDNVQATAQFVAPEGEGDWTIDAFGSSDVPADGETEAEFTVTLEDENGDRVAGEQIDLVSADDALDDLPSAVNTNDNGVATFTATSTEVGVHTATFTHAETDDVEATVEFVATEGEGSWTINAFGPSDVPADGETEAEFTVTLEDENGDRVAGEQIDLVDADDALDDLPSAVNTNDNGVATFTATSDDASTHAATFTHAETDDVQATVQFVAPDG